MGPRSGFFPATLLMYKGTFVRTTFWGEKASWLLGEEFTVLRNVLGLLHSLGVRGACETFFELVGDFSFGATILDTRSAWRGDGFGSNCLKGVSRGEQPLGALIGDLGFGATILDTRSTFSDDDFGSDCLTGVCRGEESLGGLFGDSSFGATILDTRSTFCDDDFGSDCLDALMGDSSTRATILDSRSIWKDNDVGSVCSTEVCWGEDSLGTDGIISSWSFTASVVFTKGVIIAFLDASSFESS
jgi:hypothetical protein